ncbi:MAG: GNAT family N-acetyltransferase [bacterium]|nr:GNAT family N-acetyltransferase [bacterium]
MEIERYTPARKAEWDEFIRRSKNGTFLFLRDYMDYHEDRFRDHSLMVRDARGRLLALLPAHENGKRLCSHEGLTYGGFVSDDSMKALKMVAVFAESLSYLKQHDFESVTYRTIPHIYHRAPAQEDLYALLLSDAELYSRVVISAVPGHHRLPFQELRRRGSKKASNLGVTVGASEDFDSYWKILGDVLAETYDAKPVHALGEIRLLHDRFPDNVKLYAADLDGEMVGGVVVYDTARVARAQYIAASEAGKKCNALDRVFDYLLNQEFRDKPFFEFGTSQVPDSDNLNRGLIEQKEGFGARTVVYDYYRIDLTRWTPDALQGALNA